MTIKYTIGHYEFLIFGACDLMDIFMFITLFGGLAFFLYGMKLLSDSLKKTAGGRLEKLLNKATDNQFKGLTIGAVITIALTSAPRLQHGSYPSPASIQATTYS